MNILHILLFISLFTHKANSLTPDGLTLLAFKSAISSDPFSSLSTWTEDSTDPCKWPGISCADIPNSPEPRVIGIAVPGKNLSGYIPSELGTLLYLRRLNLHGNLLSGSIPSQLFNASSLHSIFLYNNNLSGSLPKEICNLPRIQNLDFSKNLLSGSVPSELQNCRQLQRLILSGNKLSGPLPSGIWRQMLSLVQLDLASNNLTGEIPEDIGYLNSLSATLNLSHNGFSGKVPSSLGNLPATVNLDLRYNNFSGEIPAALGDQGPTAFLNNPFLCGAPLHVQCESKAEPMTRPDTLYKPSVEEKKGLKSSLIVLISVGDAVGVAFIGLVLVYIYWKVKDDKDDECGKKEKSGNRKCWKQNSGECTEEEEEEEDSGEGKLVAIDKGFKFELDELLRASAYVLGKSGMGIVYKVVLGNGVPVAVRRVGEGGRSGQKYKEFASEVQAIARVRHRNLVRLRAYYWAPDEKLLISDFVSNGNLASALRARPGHISLSWSIRLKIAKGTAHGLAHLHECSPRKFVHSDIKLSNILLDNNCNPYISDFGLIRLINISGPTNPSTSSSSLGFINNTLSSTRSALTERSNNIHRAPEARIPGARPTQKWDVYSFGVVLLEMLTGKSPDLMTSHSMATTSLSPPVEDLVGWVRRGFEESRLLSEMVDPALHKEMNAKKEIVSVFHIALACTEADPEARPRMKNVSENLDRIGS